MTVDLKRRPDNHKKDLNEVSNNFKHWQTEILWHLWQEMINKSCPRTVRLTIRSLDSGLTCKIFSKPSKLKKGNNSVKIYARVIGLGQ